MLCSLYPPTDAAGFSPLGESQGQLTNRNGCNLRHDSFSVDEGFPMQDGIAAELSQVIADRARVFTAPAVLDRLSHDFYWYSPILRPQLAGKIADVAVQPVSVDEVLGVMRCAGRLEIPVTIRGAGTGNYGQCVPLQGGIVLDLSLMDKLEAITPDGVAVCQPGLRLGAIETEARARGWELRMYPST